MILQRKAREPLGTREFSPAEIVELHRSSQKRVDLLLALRKERKLDDFESACLNRNMHNVRFASQRLPKKRGRPARGVA